MDKKIIIQIVAIILLLAVGTFVGILLDRQAIGPKMAKTEAILKVLNSKLVPGITLFGQAVGTTDKTITISYGGDTTTIAMGDDAKVMSLTNNTQQEIKLSDVQADQYINLSLSIAADGSMTANRVLVIPMTTK